MNELHLLQFFFGYFFSFLSSLRLQCIVTTKARIYSLTYSILPSINPLNHTSSINS